MDTNSKKAYALVGSTVIGAVGGGRVALRLGAAFGLTLGPWGAAAGAVIGALVGAALASMLVGEVEFPRSEKKQARLASTYGP